MSADRDSALDPLLLEAEVERFFAAEAELLDERRFDAWLDLLHDDIRYWMPIARNVRFDQPELEYTREGVDANWFDEGKDMLQASASSRSRAATIGRRSRARAPRISSPMYVSTA